MGCANTTAGAITDPWRQIHQALETLAAHGGPPEAGLQAAEGFAALGLRDAAAIWAQSVAEHVRAEPALGERFIHVVRTIEGLKNTAIDPSERVARAKVSLDTHSRLRAQLKDHFEAWERRTRSIAWFATNDGNVVGLAPDRPPTDPAWRARCRNAIGAAKAIPLDPNEPRATGVPSPVILHGMDAPLALRRICEHFVPLELGARARIFVVEEDPTQVLDALADGQLTDVLGDERVEFFVGATAQRDLVDHLRERSGLWSDLRYYTDRTRPATPPIAGMIHELLDRQADEYAQLKAQNLERYAGRTNGHWSDRIRHGLSVEAKEPLRVMLITTRFSTYIRHSTRDIANAFERSGATTRILMEPDDSSELTGLTIARAIDEFYPDVFVQINYTRAQMGALLPIELPVITWVQDGMPHLFTEKAGESIGDADLVVGSIFKEFVTKHGYPADQCLRFGVPASCAKFRSGRHAALEFDVIAATNHSECPMRMTERVSTECDAAGMHRGLARTLCEHVIRGVESWDRGWIVWVLQDALDRTLEERGLQLEDADKQVLLRDVAHPLANRVLRFRTLSWGAELAREHGLRFKLFGRGWEENPEMREFAGGPLDHGDQLREAYASSAVTLHASSAWMMHQRLYESALAGGLPAALLRPEDSAHALRPARAYLCEEGIEATVCRVRDRAHCVTASEHLHAACALRLAQRLDIGQGRECRVSFVSDDVLQDGLIPIGAGDSAPVPNIRELPSKLEQLRLIEALSSSMFSCKASLGAVIERARHDGKWREERSRWIANIAERSFSYESTVPEMMEVFADRLAVGTGTPLSRESSVARVA